MLEKHLLRMEDDGFGVKGKGKQTSFGRSSIIVASGFVLPEMGCVQSGIVKYLRNDYNDMKTIFGKPFPSQDSRQRLKLSL